MASGRVRFTYEEVMSRSFVIALSVALYGCMTATDKAPPLPTTPKSEAAGAPVARTPLETPAILVPGAPSKAAPPLSPPTIQPNTLYVCVTQRDGQQQQTAIEFSPRVAKLCGKHPEMGPCQYERNICRASGGRVFAANGQEITMLTEAEYDKKVMRVRFKAN
jgi:hypothetical protein